ncbi:YrrS family protein [Atopococcus tabaci]|uniref:YrrS family protein n=1 Tax=Atopococcus tabaci TaxID=269774 RepID=UPI0003F62A94|nr:YrrS family protein [Atopococcus tabaci]
MKNNQENKKQDNELSRTKRNGTERRKSKLIYSAVVGGLLIILLLLLVSIFSGGEEPETQQAGETDTSFIVQDSTADSSAEDTASDSSEEADSSTSDENAQDTEEENEEQDTSEDEEKKDTDEENEENVEPAEPSDDLVTRAYTGDWDPIGTSQEGEHTTDFSNGSQDRIEIKQAVSSVTGLNPDNMIEWWVGNDGPDKVVATVTDGDQTETYRVYLSWVDNGGWKPTKVEELRENDKR